MFSGGLERDRGIKWVKTKIILNHFNELLNVALSFFSLILSLDNSQFYSYV